MLLLIDADAAPGLLTARLAHQADITEREQTPDRIYSLSLMGPQQPLSLLKQKRSIT